MIPHWDDLTTLKSILIVEKCHLRCPLAHRKSGPFLRLDLLSVLPSSLSVHHGPCCHSCSHSDYIAHHAALLTSFFSQFPHRKDSRVGSHAARLYIRLSLPNRVKGVSWEAIRHRGAQSHRGKYWCPTGAGLGDVGFVIFILALILLIPSSLKH